MQRATSKKPMSKQVKSISKLTKEADKYFSIYIRRRDSIERGGEYYCECITCGDVRPIGQMHAGHFVSRRYKILRYDERNVNAQCPKCNTFHSGEQYLYSKAIDNKYGSGIADELHSMRNNEFIVTRDWLEGLVKTYKDLTK